MPPAIGGQSSLPGGSKLSYPERLWQNSRMPEGRCPLDTIDAMYLPAHFAESRPEELHRILREHPLGILIVNGPDGLDANHIPFLFDPPGDPKTPGESMSSGNELGRLTGHVARANPVWQHCPTGTEVLVVFRGAEGYISPNWYPSKHDAHRQVPTWNYEVVHAHGHITIHDDERFLRGLLARLTRTHEAGEPRPWKMGDAPADYLAERLREIVGIEIAITSLVGKRKLSQNKEVRDQQGAVSALRERGDLALAEAMVKAAPAPTHTTPSTGFRS